MLLTVAVFTVLHVTLKVLLLGSKNLFRPWLYYSHMHLTWYTRNKYDLFASLCKEWFYNLWESNSLFNSVTVNLTFQVDVSRLRKSRIFSVPRILLQLLQVQSFYFSPIIAILSKSMYQYEFIVLVVIPFFSVAKNRSFWKFHRIFQHAINISKSK